MAKAAKFSSLSSNCLRMTSLILLSKFNGSETMMTKPEKFLRTHKSLLKSTFQSKGWKDKLPTVKTTPVTRIRGWWCCSLVKENGYVTSDGIEISAIERMNKGNNVALILLHGSYHAKWCYLEHFFDYFGYENADDGQNVDVFAMDFRGQGESGMKKDGGKH